MKKVLLGLLCSTSLLGFMVVTVAADETISSDGLTKTVSAEDSTTIPVQGTLGADNTNPNEPNIPEGDNGWVNITAPTKTYFYSIGSSPNITSPVYSVKNNSGRPVNITFSEFNDNATAVTTTSKDGTPSTLEKIDTSTEANNVNVSIQKVPGTVALASEFDAAVTAGTGVQNTQVITAGQAGAAAITPMTVSLANNEGKKISQDTVLTDSALDAAANFTFAYRGTIATPLATALGSNYDLILTFSVPKDLTGTWTNGN